MTFTPRQRLMILTLSVAILALFMGSWIANENYAFPVLMAGATVAMVISLLRPASFSILGLGFGLIGYIVGNRGFAQFSILRGLPLLPAEIILILCSAALALRSVRTKHLPWEKDVLNFAILIWMLAGTWRLFFDFKLYGIGALRDYATVYYAVLFFIAQSYAREPRTRQFLNRCLLFGCLTLPGLYVIYRIFPGFFLEKLTFRDSPLIFYKDDLVGTMLAAGSILCFLRYESENRIRWLLASLVMILVMLSTNNRASMAGLGVGTMLLCAGGRWRLLSWQFMSGITAALLILLTASYFPKIADTTPLYSSYEKIASFADPVGRRSYVTDDAADKGDNNLFRYIWWSTCIEETNHKGPWFGLGWGYDLADPFIKTYYPTSTDAFTVRSPHNILITLYARTGLVGLAPFLVVCVVIFKRTRLAARNFANHSLAYWCVCSVILTSACFGVVLEGPMGALPFWVCLGLANAKTDESMLEQEAADEE